MSKKLKEYCSKLGLQLDRCKKPGYWVISFSERPTSYMFLDILRDLEEIGYEYRNDIVDSKTNTYCAVIKKK